MREQDSEKRKGKHLSWYRVRLLSFSLVFAVGGHLSLTPLHSRKPVARKVCTETRRAEYSGTTCRFAVCSKGKQARACMPVCSFSNELSETCQVLSRERKYSSSLESQVWSILQVSNWLHHLSLYIAWEEFYDQCKIYCKVQDLLYSYIISWIMDCKSVEYLVPLSWYTCYILTWLFLFFLISIVQHLGIIT